MSNNGLKLLPVDELEWRLLYIKHEEGNKQVIVAYNCKSLRKDDSFSVQNKQKIRNSSISNTCI